jgi:ubiquinone/menaquinone biosynthesis C-methylase UbiE
MGLLDRWLGRPAETTSKIRAAEIRAYFNRAAGDEEHYPSTIDPRIWHVKLVLEQLEACMGAAPGKRLADIGCGKGRYARIVKEHWPAAHVIAVDLAEAMLAHVPANLERVAASMTALPLAAESVDAAYATESLEHAVDIPAAVAELARIVKKGGRIVIIDKDKEAWGRLNTPEWERWFGRKELERLLGRHCRRVWSQPISYWEDVPPDGLFLAWFGER